MPGAFEDVSVDGLVEKQLDFNGLIFVIPDSKVRVDVNLLFVIRVGFKCVANNNILHARKIVGTVLVVLMAEAHGIPVAFLTVNFVRIKRVGCMLCAAD